MRKQGGASAFRGDCKVMKLQGRGLSSPFYTGP